MPISRLIQIRIRIQQSQFNVNKPPKELNQYYERCCFLISLSISSTSKAYFSERSDEHLYFYRGLFLADAEILYDHYFLKYATYVVKNRAIPEIDDGLKPVQRRILHTLFEIDDGKYH